MTPRATTEAQVAAIAALGGTVTMRISSAGWCSECSWGTLAVRDGRIHHGPVTDPGAAYDRDGFVTWTVRFHAPVPFRRIQETLNVFDGWTTPDPVASITLQWHRLLPDGEALCIGTTCLSRPNASGPFLRLDRDGVLSWGMHG